MTKIEIDLKDLGMPTFIDGEGEPGGSASMQDLIIQAAADRLILNDASMRRQVQAKVQEYIDIYAEASVRTLVQEAIEAPIQRRASWGDKIGEPTTVKEIIREKVEMFLSSTGRNDNSGFGRDPKNLKDIIDDAVRNIMTKDLKAMVDKAKSQVHNTITEAALKAAADVLAKK